MIMKKPETWIKLKWKGQPSYSRWVFFFKCLIMRKTCYVTTVVSKVTPPPPPEGLRGEGRFPIRHWLKKDNQKDIAADSLY